jgi:hypothetical protein
MNYTLSYNYEPQLNCGIIHFNDKYVLMDFEDLFSIINFDKKFIHYTSDKLYPFYLRHNQRITYLEYIFKYDSENIEYIFKNNNSFDLRRGNITIYHNYHKQVVDKNQILEYTLGHYIEIGKDAYVIKNPMWKIKENYNEYWLMYCETNTIIKLCSTSYQKILDYESENNDGKKLTFFRHLNGYICSSSGLYIHQIITGCYGNGKGTKNISVDHIDQDPLNNTMSNLRVATRKEQEQNSKGIKDGTKRERKHNAKNLPEGVTQDMMRKYVVYYQEWLDKEHTKEREFFKIEKHPKLDKNWTTTKSGKISIQEKLADANKVVDDLENDIYPEKEEAQLPKYVSLVVMREKSHLIFEKRIVDGKRLNIKMVLPDEYDLQEQLDKLNEKIKEKYKNISLFDENIQMLDKFKYKLCIDLDNITKNIDKITFDISRYAKYKKTIHFDEMVTVKFAVEKAEELLSEKLTIDYYNSIKDDVFFKFNSIDEELEYINNKNKGQLLTDCIWLEESTIYSTHLIISCGS